MDIAAEEDIDAAEIVRTIDNCPINLTDSDSSDSTPLAECTVKKSAD